MVRYSLKKFIEDCKSMGWYEGKTSPAWKDEMDLPVKKSDLEKVLLYKEEENSIPTIMDYKKKEKGVRFSTEYMGDSTGRGFVDNEADLRVYMKVVGLNKDVAP